MPLVTIDPPDAKDHDDAVHAEPDPAPNNKGGFIVTVAIADVAHYVHAGLGARPRSAGARQFGLFPRPRRADAARAHLQRSVLAAPAARTAPRSRCAWSSAPTAASARTRFHRIMMRSAAKLSYQQAQLAIGGRTDEDTEPLLAPVLEPLYAAYEALDASARRTLAARSRSARAQDPAEARRHRRPRDHAGAAGGAPADRGVHDPRQRRRRRDAGEGARAADLSRARRAVAWRRSTRCANSCRRSTSVRQRRRAAAGSLQPRSRARERPRRRAAGQRGRAAHARRRPNMRRRITATSASTCAATRISPRRSAAMPI